MSDLQLIKTSVEVILRIFLTCVGENLQKSESSLDTVII